MTGRLVGAVLLLWSVRLSVSGSGECPPVCLCKWKGGKQTVECTRKGIISFPEGIDSETQVLDLSHNNFQTIPRDIFIRTNLLNLQKIYIKNSLVGRINETAFKGLTNLVELDLSQNLLPSVPSSSFQYIPSLRDLNLANNPIKKIEEQAFRTIPGLIKLDLSGCGLHTIAPKAFEGVELLEILKLNDNELGELKYRTVDSLSRLQGVELYNNPWHCDCHLRATKIWLTNYNIPYSVPPMCSGGPERVAHKSFSELDIDDFACKPEIKLNSRHIEATTGESALIVCKVHAVPEATVNWYSSGRIMHNNSVLNSYQRVTILESGTEDKKSTLVISNIQEADSGDVFCVAENRAGNAEANFSVNVAYRMAGISSLGSGQIAGLSAALVVLIFFILLVILVLLMRLRRGPYEESKTPASVEVVSNGNALQKVGTPVSIESSSFAEVKDGNLGVGASPRAPRTDSVYTTTLYDCNGTIVNFSSTNPASNPDLINDTREESPLKPGNGEYSRVSDSGLYPSWDESCRSCSVPGLDSCDRTPIIAESYPPDYGLPIPGQGSGPQPSAKTLRVWQRGVPVLPPVSALKRVLVRNSPDEGYQEGTDV